MLVAIFNSVILFLVKVLSNMLGTGKTILVQRNKAILAGLALALSDLIYLLILKNVVSDNSILSTIVVALGSGVGCYLAIMLSEKVSKDRLYVNVFLCDDKYTMQEFATFLASHNIVTVVSDSYDRELQNKTLTITCYSETKAQSKIIDKYLESSTTKIKRVLYK